MYVYCILAGYTPIFCLYNNSGNNNNVRIRISIRKKWGYWTSFYQQTSSSFFCTHIGHQGSTSNIKMESEFCQLCSKATDVIYLWHVDHASTFTDYNYQSIISVLLNGNSGDKHLVRLFRDGKLSQYCTCESTVTFFHIMAAMISIDY